MTNNLLNFLALIICIFGVTLLFEISKFDNAIASNNNAHFRVKSHLVFDKKFSGKTKVLDGDSIKVGNKEVRLFGIDAPEYKQKCLDISNQEYNCGIVSKDFLVKIIGGKFVECFYAEKDKYDRFLAKCYLNKIYINQEIVKNGMAVIYNFSESDDTMNDSEEQAKNSKIGIWQGSFQLPKEYRKSNSRF